jgi:hypothetical protein
MNDNSIINTTPKSVESGLHFSNDILNEINKQLVVAGQLYNQDNDGQIEGFLHALRTIREGFINFIGPNQTLLFHLELDLMGLQESITADWMKAPKRKGQPSKPYNAELAKSQVAAALSFYMKDGLNRSEASKKIAYKTRLWDFSLKKEKLTGTTIENWRKKYNEFHIPDSLGQIYYDRLMDGHGKNYSELTYTKYAEWLISESPNKI